MMGPVFNYLGQYFFLCPPKLVNSIFPFLFSPQSSSWLTCSYLYLILSALQQTLTVECETVKHGQLTLTAIP